MASSRTLIAIACVAIVAIAGASVIVLGGDGDNDEVETRTVTITDSLGKNVDVQAPVMKICTVNTNAAEFFKILGVEDRVVSADSVTISSLDNIYGDVLDIGDYKSPSGEKIVQSGAKIVISQSSSRSLSEETEQALKDNYGITVLRLDCYGETMQQDVKKLLNIFVSDSADKQYEGYSKTYNDVRDAVLNKAKDFPGDPSFLMLFTSMSSKQGTYYNENSQLGKIVESIHGHPALTDMGVSPGSGVTSKPAAEAVYDYDQKGSLGYVFIRGVSGNSASTDYETWVKTLSSFSIGDFNVVKNGNVYVIETDVLSGPRDYVGYVCIAEAFGIDTGLDYVSLVEDFNSKYGFDVKYGYIMTQFPTA